MSEPIDLSAHPDPRTRERGGRQVHELGLTTEGDRLARDCGYRNYAHLMGDIRAGGKRRKTAERRLEERIAMYDARAKELRETAAAIQGELDRRDAS